MRTQQDLQQTKLVQDRAIFFYGGQCSGVGLTAVARHCRRRHEQLCRLQCALQVGRLLSSEWSWRG